MMTIAKSFFGCFLIFMTTIGFAATHNDIIETLNYMALYPNFDLSLQRYGESQDAYTWLFTGDEAPQREYFKFKVKANKLYNSRRKFFNLKHRGNIPRIIHQIWLGSSVPEKYQELIATWQGWNGWTYLLWTDEDVKSLKLKNQFLYDNAQNYGERADILRFELLYRFGGLYVDTDFACLDPGFFNFAHQQYSFYIGIEPLEHAPVSCCNALIASAPGHPLMKKIIDNLEANVQQHLDETAVERTGPRYLTKLIASNIHLLSGGIIFPPTFFYPIHSWDIEALSQNKKRFIHPETVAIHFWTGSWRHDKALIEK